MSQLVSPLSLRLHPESDMPIRHPVSGEVLSLPDGRPQTLRLRGMDSEACQAAVAAFYAGREGNASLTPAEQRELTQAMLAACLAGWEMIGVDGEPLVYSPKLAAEQIADPAIRWLWDQADAWAVRREHFLGEG